MLNRPASDAGSINSYSMYGSAHGEDQDNIPLSQRKEMMRHSGLMISSNPSLSHMELAEKAKFDSHQPRRNSNVPTHAAREAKLAQFRDSVATDLRNGSPMLTPSGRETAFASNSSLLSGREAEVQRNIQIQRNTLLGQKEAETHLKEMKRRDKERAEQMFEDRMRNSEMRKAHREAMRRMEQGAKKDY